MKNMVIVIILMCVFMFALIMLYIDGIISGIMLTRDAYRKNITPMFGCGLVATLLMIFPPAAVIGFIVIAICRMWLNVVYKERWMPFIITIAVIPSISVLLMVGSLCTIIVMYLMGVVDGTEMFSDFIQSLPFKI